MVGPSEDVEEVCFCKAKAKAKAVIPGTDSISWLARLVLEPMKHD
uniref:Uncharacterized protein n=1 Tax=Candidatus Kentrum sp. LFY TaxID=2126342 RepID=A0A450WRK6_9GAMM|nr:MAG: hypothetical protein BECKLFY1418C_GA0070996_106111 [Candidatus Kentron sp. LFY]